MNRSISISLIIITVGFLYSCGPLEGSHVIGPGGGFVFYDKGSYSDGWRYLESVPKSSGRLSGISGEKIDFAEAREIADKASHGGYRDWRLPSDYEFLKMAHYFLRKSLVNDNPPDNGGLVFKDTTFYVTSDDHVYACKTEITTNSEGKKRGKSEFIQGSGMYEKDGKYIVHLIRGF